MGKKSGKKGKLGAVVENAEPNLATITEEENLGKIEDLQDNHGEQAEISSEPRKSIRSIKRSSKSNTGLEAAKSKSVIKSISKSNTGLTEIGAERSESLGGVEVRKSASAIRIESPEVVEENDKVGGKKQKEKKGKKDKKGKTKTQMEGEAEGDSKPKKSKKEKPESSGEKASKTKKAKKEKKVELEPGENEADKPELEDIEEKAKIEATTEEGKSKKKKGKREKKEETDTEASQKKEKTAKDKKAKKDVEKVTKETQKDVDDGEEEKIRQRSKSKSDSKLRALPSRVSFSSKTDVRKKSFEGGERSRTQIKAEDRKKSRASLGARASLAARASLSARASLGTPSERLSSYMKLKHRKTTDSVLSEGHGRKRPAYSSRMSIDTDISSTESSESSPSKEERGKKKKGKRDKKQKGEKRDRQKTGEDESDEEKRKQKKAELKELKDAKKAEKKAAKKAAKKEAAEAAKKEAAEAAKKGKTSGKDEKVVEMSYDDVKKKLEDLKKKAKEMGIEEVVAEDGDEKGPKKKISKKEKARLTAEMAEKAKAELEAQAKRMEELIRKRKEEERLAAIEKDKRESLEQGIRMEQLQASASLIDDIINTNAEVTRKEKELLEWEKYLECGELPNPTICAQMNTYLHLWGLVLEKTNVKVASHKTKDAIKLLDDLDELIDTITEEELNKLDNWKWVRQLFREYQASSLDVATYRLLRDVEHNLNRINIPTADFNFKDDHVTLCIWLRVMLPIPLPNPRRPPKPRIDISFNLMEVSVLFPLSIDCEDAAIRAMYLKYDHLSDLSETFHMPEVPKDYYLDLISVSKKEWRTKLKYKYDNRDKKSKPAPEPVQESPKHETESSSPENLESNETKPNELDKTEMEKKLEAPEPEEFSSDEEIPLVPFKQLKPNANEHVLAVEDQLYSDTRHNLYIDVPDCIINLRKFVILGGVYHLNLLAQPPQPQDFITMEMTITGLYLPKKLEILPFKVIYTPYVPPEPEPSDSNTSVPRKLPEEIEEEMKKQEEELDKLISINIKWPQHVIFLELPIVCRWDEEKKQWSKEEIHDLKHNEEKCILSFRTGVFGIYGLASYRYANLPFQAYDIKPELDDSVTVQLTAAILMLEFNIKDGLISFTQLQNSPNMTLQDVVGKYFKLHQLKRMMKQAGIDIFPAFDAFCYVEGCCEKQWAMEQQLYYNMAQMANSFNFSWSRWNLQAGRRKIVLQMRQYSADKSKQKNHQMLLVTPLKATFIECTEVSQVFSEKEMDSLKFCADLYHLMKTTSGIFVRNKVMKSSKLNVYTLAEFLKSIRIMSFS